jgi:hypothetical protein
VASPRRKKGYLYPPPKMWLLGQLRPAFSGPDRLFPTKNPAKNPAPYWHVAPLECSRGPAFSGPRPAFFGPPKLAETPKRKQQ